MDTIGDILLMTLSPVFWSLLGMMVVLTFLSIVFWLDL